ncbi:MAG TPA: hypothetical protein VKB17_10270 [Thermoleophilaceae bacterium]|nr:hypothetical protein [Thermoleophilaceae bacterium]
MPTLLDKVRHVLAPHADERPVCLVCGRAVAPRDDRMRLRGGVVVHRACATYNMRRRRSGPRRLGYPRR